MLASPRYDPLSMAMFPCQERLASGRASTRIATRLLFVIRPESPSDKEDSTRCQFGATTCTVSVCCTDMASVPGGQAEAIYPCSQLRIAKFCKAKVNTQVDYRDVPQWRRNPPIRPERNPEQGVPLLSAGRTYHATPPPADIQPSISSCR
mgnify:CR=1 FL=1|jgi:hypothetical protein